MLIKEIRWLSLIALGILFSLVSLGAELTGIWPWKDVRPDLLFCLADIAGSFSLPGPGIFSYAVCGLLRDLFIGPKLGAGMAAYLCAGFLLISWRNVASPKGWLENILLAGIMSGFASWLRIMLDEKSFAAVWSAEAGWTALGNGFATAVAYAFLLIVIRLPWLCPWQEKEARIFNF